jgi:hypothetical protein
MAPPVDDDGPSWGACQAEADNKGPWICEDCEDDVAQTIRRGRTR